MQYANRTQSAKTAEWLSVAYKYTRSFWQPLQIGIPSSHSYPVVFPSPLHSHAHFNFNSHSHGVPVPIHASGIFVNESHVTMNHDNDYCINFYRAMHFSAKRGIAIACRLSVRPSVRPSVTLVNCDHIGWNSSKIISPLVSLGRSLFVTPTRRVCSKGNTPKFSPE